MTVLPLDPDPVTIAHPARVSERRSRWSPARKRIVRVETPVRLARLDRADLARVTVMPSPGDRVGWACYAGPGGLWTRICDPYRNAIPAEAVIAYLAGRPLPRAVSDTLNHRFDGTPVGARECGGGGFDSTMAFRGDAEPVARADRLDLDERDEAARHVAAFAAGEIARVDDHVYVRARPFGILPVTAGIGWRYPVGRGLSGLGQLPARPDDWEAVAAIARGFRDDVGAPDPAWLRLAPHWPDEGADDALRALNDHLPQLRRRLESRHVAIRTHAPEHPLRDAVASACAELASIEWRALVGTAGAPGREADMQVFRNALRLEAGIARERGEAVARRTGAAQLHDWFEAVAAPRLDRLPGTDAEAIDALAPGARP